MGIRLQPAEIDIPDDPDGNPFEHDLLERKDSIEALTTLLGNVSGPCVMAVDASWGMGKTTFLRMWTQHLKNKHFPVVEFNAWETDYADQPFVALTSEVTDGLRGLLDDLDSPSFKELVESSGRVLSSLSAPAVRLAASTVPFMGHQLVEELDRHPSNLAETMTADYRSMKEAMSDFRTRLEKIAKEAAAKVDNRPLVVLIDELDRCRPTYAIELLETAKHFFSVDHVVFVVCLDRKQLAHSVRAVYGSGFAAEGYLHRFFDFDYRLPDPHRGQFISATLDSLGVTQRLQQDQPRTRYTLAKILDNRALSLRDLAQTTHRLAMILLSIPQATPSHICTLALLLVLRTLDAEHYRRLIAGHASDAEAVSVLDGEPSDISNVPIEAEAIICMTAWYYSQDDRGNRKPEMTPRYNHYETLIQENHINAQNATDDDIRRARAVVGCTYELRDEPSNSRRFGHGAALYPQQLRALIRHLELFPDDLDERTAL